MNFHSPVYSYFKICNYKKKGTMWIRRHILSLYTHISKYVGTKRTMCLFIHIFSMYTHILKFVVIKELCVFLFTYFPCIPRFQNL